MFSGNFHASCSTNGAANRGVHRASDALGCHQTPLLIAAGSAWWRESLGNVRASSRPWLWDSARALQDDARCARCGCDFVAVSFSRSWPGARPRCTHPFPTSRGTGLQGLRAQQTLSMNLEEPCTQAEEEEVPGGCRDLPEHPVQRARLSTHGGWRSAQKGFQLRHWAP